MMAILIYIPTMDRYHAILVIIATRTTSSTVRHNTTAIAYVRAHLTRSTCKEDRIVCLPSLLARGT